ncbi:MAG: hypothetical protein ABJD68_09470 [Nakamurella sp.]
MITRRIRAAWWTALALLLAVLAGCSSGASEATQAGLDRLERELKSDPSVVSLETGYHRQALQGESTAVNIVLTDGATSDQIFDLVNQTLDLHADLDRPDSALLVSFTFNADQQRSRISYNVVNRKSPNLIEPFRADIELWLDTIEHDGWVNVDVDGAANRYRRDVGVWAIGGPADLPAVFQDIESRWDIETVAGNWITCLSAAGDQLCRGGSRITSYDRPPSDDVLGLIGALSAPPAPVELTALTIEENLPGIPSTKFTSYLTVPALIGVPPPQAVAQAPAAGVPAMVDTLQGLICDSRIPLAMHITLVPTATYSTLTTDSC